MTRIRSVVSLGLLLVAPAFALQAQAPAPQGVVSPCTYRTCAVRVEPVFLGRALKVGATGDSSSKLGGWGGGVGVLLAGPDSAAKYANVYVSATRRATTFGLIAAVSFAIVHARTDFSRNEPRGADAALALGGAGFAIATIPFAIRAQRSLSRSVWWYNEALPR